MTFSCCFNSARLSVININPLDPDDVNCISSILTPATTLSLPPPWQGVYSPERSRSWLSETATEGITVLLVLEQTEGRIGLVILCEVEEDSTSTTKSDLRLGYIFSQSSWGNGYATELVSGLITWCKESRSTVRTVSGGVAKDNISSVRVLEKSGFKRMSGSGESDTSGEEELLFRYTLCCDV